jgi:KamA family protein
MPLRRLTMPRAVRVLGLLASVRALRTGPVARRPTALRSSAETELTVDPIAVTTEGEYSANEMAPEAAVEKAERFRAINAKDLDKWGDRHPRLKEKLQDIKRSALIFPFKASPYLVDELIDWEMEGDIALDPFYKLVFPTMAMLDQHHQDDLNAICDAGDPKEIKMAIERIREDLNPHPAGQKTLNAPKKAELTGVQHKYAETVLFFAAAAQTCHAYCTYCFRWAQFIGDADLRFAQKDADSLFDYIEDHPEITDILFTGGDPMIMKTNMLKQYFEPFIDPEHLPHVKNLRIGTRALTFWPQRFTTDPDADSLMKLLKDVKEIGGRHVAIMAHLSHYREISTKKVQHAIHRLKQEAGVIIRSQSPIMAGINDDAAVWNKKWKEEVRLGIIPYYMFIARDTGAQAYFNVPLVRAQKIYAEAIRSTSGLCRTARGPSMSCTPGKVEICGVQTIQGTDAFVCRFLQCRDDEWIGKIFFAKFDPKAIWYDDLEALPGMSLPWEEAGLPRPCIDEPCQVEWMDEFMEPVYPIEGKQEVLAGERVKNKAL